MMNRGARMLAAFAARHSNQAALAKELGLDQSYLNRLVRGERSPGAATRRLLEERCKIRMQEWDRR